jgi:hypothetical protein
MISTKSQIQTLLNNNRITDAEQKLTHLSYGSFNGKFSLDKKARKQFMKLYTQAILEGVKDLSILERQQEYAPILIDIDLKLSKDKYSEKRLYDSSMIEQVAQAYYKAVEHFFDTNEDLFKMFLFQKAEVAVKENIIKDGFHLVMPHLCAKPDIRHAVRKYAINHLNDTCPEMFQGFEEPIEKIIDNDVVSKNAWFLYGSVKPETGLGYTLTYDISFENGKIQREESEHEVEQIIDYFSLQSSTYSEKQATKLKENVSITEDSEQKSEKSNSSRDSDEIVLKKIQEVLEIIPCETLFDDRNDWLKAGMICKSDGGDTEDAFKIWVEASKRNSKFVSEFDCHKTWESFKSTRGKKATIGSLYFWAEKFNPEAYHALQAKWAEVEMQQKEEKLAEMRKQQNIQKMITDADYLKKKAIFEKKNFKVRYPVMFVEIDGDNIRRRKRADLVTGEEHVHYDEIRLVPGDNGKFVEKIEKQVFIKKWLADEDMRIYDKIDFLPCQQAPADVFNTFRGFEAEKKPLDSSVKIEETLLYKHLENLSGNDAKAREYVLNCLANIIQHPYRLTQTSLLFKSVQGCGKDTFFDYFGTKILGQKYYYESSNLDDIFGTFNAAISDKLLVVLNEAAIEGTSKISSRIKGLITQPINHLNEKNIVKWDETNNIFYVWLSNQECPLVIEESDRRMGALECNNKIANKLDYFVPLRAELNSGKIDRAFFEFLKNRNIEGFDFSNERPKTELYKNMKQHNIPVVGRYLSEFVDDFKDHTEETISFYANELFELFSQYLMKSKYKFELNATSFGFELKKYDAISKVRKAKGISYVINLKELKQILIQKEYYEVLPEFIDEDENVPKKPKAREIKI